MQLLWNSVFAPSAAVDLAKQHPNTTQLGWIYVAALIIAAFGCELIVRYAVRPLFGIIVEEQSDPFAWMDTVAGSTTSSINSSVVLLPQFAIFLGYSTYYFSHALGTPLDVLFEIQEPAQ
ncbi:MAG: hypothetical protein ABL931_22865 [Usitatibacteraceae bacterium]